MRISRLADTGDRPLRLSISTVAYVARATRASCRSRSRESSGTRGAGIEMRTVAPLGRFARKVPGRRPGSAEDAAGVAGRSAARSGS
ncbi:hypothetical protein C1C97_002715 [Kocuria tytonis]|uniref:Uncharacterized protein n=1 Tax=Kocuria tytonis TaxID=2054280 RepID=A0A495A9B9_9MICC|nr:hypothetical protein C1C97_002715 [Kocuria tytonis]